MCDTILAMAAATGSEGTLFGKNSDRQRNEAQVVEKRPGRDYGKDAHVLCTYVPVPQVRRTNTVLLCRPHWGWGAEMGANEHGVAIGNEAVHARVPPSEAAALTGMDLLRLALERAESAEEAVDVITSLLSTFGQGGDCGHMIASYYHNSFLIADANEGFVLETVGREWLTERVTKTRSISNRYSIGAGLDRSSGGLARLVDGADMAGGYAAVLADPQRQHLGDARARQDKTQALLDARTGEIDVVTLMSILRDHGDEPGWEPARANHRTICMHAQGQDKQGQTTGSLVSTLKPERSVHWVTATAAPCFSVFKPVLLDAEIPDHGPPPTDRFDPSSLWWRHEQAHRAALALDFNASLDQFARDRDRIEAAFRERISAISDADRATRQDAVDTCWSEAIWFEDDWRTRLGASPGFDNSAYGIAWKKMNRLAGLT